MTISGHTSGAVVVGVTSATTVVAGLTVISRLITRVLVVRKGGIDDVCILIAIVLSIALTITMCEQVKYGMGRHYGTLTDGDKLHLLQWFWASVWIYYLSLCFTKVSILLQYLRVFPSERTRKACFILMGVVVAYSLATFLTSVFACVPVDSFWNPTIKGTCVNLKAVWFTNASINIVTDICTGVLPLPTLNTLNLPRRQKYLLMAVFALGGCTCIISILRLQSLYVVSVSPDITWDNPLPAIWSSSEVNAGIVCSCLPTLKGGVARIFPRLFPSGNSANHQSGRQTRTIGGSEPELPGSIAKAFELVDGDKSGTKSHVRTSESEESLTEVDTYRSPDDIHENARLKNFSWLHDASSTEDTETRASKTGTQDNKAMSSYQVV